MFHRNKQILVFAIVLMVLTVMLLNSINIRGRYSYESASTVKAHRLALVMFEYATDHDDIYPAEGSSTSIVKTLFTSGYLKQSDYDCLFLFKKVPTCWGFDYEVPQKGKECFAGNPRNISAKNISWDITIHNNNNGLTIRDVGNIPLLISDVQSPLTLTDGNNPLILKTGDAWGLDGVTITLFDQSVSFRKADKDTHSVNLTQDLKVDGKEYETVVP